MSQTKEEQKEIVANNLQSVVESVRETLGKYPFIDVPLTTLSAKLKTDKVYVASGFVVISMLLASYFGTGHLILDFLGCLYLLISTTKKRESGDVESYSFLLNSWMCYTFFKFLENLLDRFICTLQFYIVIKAAFLVWLLSPMFKGSNLVYHHVVRPMVLSKAARVERREKGAERDAKLASSPAVATPVADVDVDATPEVKKEL